MFVVPKSAGGRPWFLGSLAAVALVCAGAGAWIVHAIAPETQAATATKVRLPERPPVEVVEALPQLKARLDYLGEHKQFMGAILVAKGDQVLFRQVYGKANYENDQPLKLDTRFRDTGLDTWVGENGATLSAGQARRLALARALLRDAPLLLLDEPTEGLDQDTADALMRDIAAATQGRSVLIISHAALPDGVVDTRYRLRDGKLIKE